MQQPANIQTAIIQVLAYYDVFHYPLSLKEIARFLPCTAKEAAVASALDELQATSKVFCFETLYLLHNEPSLVERRLKGNAKAVSEIEKAVKTARRLYCFPFVRCIAVSGSLSKNYADDKSDVDYFIIMKANRLWIGRTILHIVHKFSWIMGRKKWVCLNYYIDEAALQIEEQNIFTATEVATLLPLAGFETYTNFMQANSWIQHHFPQYSPRTTNGTTIAGKLKVFTEKIFSNGFGNWLEKNMRRFTAGRWKQKAKLKRVNPKGIPIGILAGEHYAKPDPANLQRMILEQYKKRLIQFDADNQ